MSTPFSNSRALDLTIARSRTRAMLLAALGLALCAALLLLALRGYLALALALSLPVGLQLWCLRRASPDGLRLRWRAGVWQLGRGEREESVVLQTHYSGLRWLVVLVLRADRDGRRRTLWLFHDALEREQIRRLRVRLALGG